MAHYVQIPKDLNDIKQKFMFGLTKRQVISFGIGGVLGIPLFFLTRSTLGVSGAIFAMGAVAAPALICGLYKSLCSSVQHTSFRQIFLLNFVKYPCNTTVFLRIFSLSA